MQPPIGWHRVAAGRLSWHIPQRAIPCILLPRSTVALPQPRPPRRSSAQAPLLRRAAFPAWQKTASPLAWLLSVFLSLVFPHCWQCLQPAHAWWWMLWGSSRRLCVAPLECIRLVFSTRSREFPWRFI